MGFKCFITVLQSVLGTRFDHISAIYNLLVEKLSKRGGGSRKQCQLNIQENQNDEIQKVCFNFVYKIIFLLSKHDLRF